MEYENESGFHPILFGSKQLNSSAITIQQHCQCCHEKYTILYNIHSNEWKYIATIIIMYITHNIYVHSVWSRRIKVCKQFSYYTQHTHTLWGVKAIAQSTLHTHYTTFCKQSVCSKIQSSLPAKYSIISIIMHVKHVPLANFKHTHSQVQAHLTNVCSCAYTHTAETTTNSSWSPCTWHSTCDSHTDKNCMLLADGIK